MCTFCSEHSVFQTHISDQTQVCSFLRKRREKGENQQLIKTPLTSELLSALCCCSNQVSAFILSNYLLNFCEKQGAKQLEETSLT